MSEIVRTVARIFAPLIFLFGIYTTLHGHLAPGGGFDGGVIIAGSVVLSLLAYGGKANELFSRRENASTYATSGILIFLIIAILGMVMGGIFFLNFLGKGSIFQIFSAGIVPLCNICIAIVVGGAISVVVLSLILFGRES